RPTEAVRQDPLWPVPAKRACRRQIRNVRGVRAAGRGENGDGLMVTDNEHGRPSTTTDAGIAAPSDDHSLTIGPDGPIALHDVYLVEQMAQFNRERVPERQPHAKGGGAHGRFEVTGDVSAYTKAGLFQPGARTEMLARFSTVAGE